MIISRHAAEKYVERVDRRSRWPKRDIFDAINRRRLFVHRLPRSHFLIGCYTKRYVPYVCHACLGWDGELKIITVGPPWFWHETRLYWKKLTGDKNGINCPSAIRRCLNDLFGRIKTIR